MKKSLFYILLMMGLLVALPSHAIKYPSYKPTYRSTSCMEQRSHSYERRNISVAVVTPVANYEATVYTPFGNAKPQHDWNVSVSGGASAPSGPRRVETGGWGNGDDDDDDDDDENKENLIPGDIINGVEDPDQPVGALPILLMLMLATAYAAQKRVRMTQETRE